MKKQLSTVVVAMTIAAAVWAANADEQVLDSTLATPEAMGVTTEEPAWLEFGVDVDFMTAFVWRSTICGDEPVFEPCVWFDLVRFEPFWIGGSVWQNWDLTCNRKEYAPRAMNETDFNIHIGATIWESDDENYALELELGNDFYTYRQIEDCPDSYELYLKAHFKNPFVNVYGQYAQAYAPISACYFELGLDKEVNLGEMLESEDDILNRFTLGADWNIGLGSGKYFTNYLYGTIPGAYDAELGDYVEEDMSNGVGGTTIKGTIAYAVCDHLSIGLCIAYTALLSSEARDAMDFAAYGSAYKQLVWGGLQAKLEF